MEFIVILKNGADDVRIAYKASQQQEAIETWQCYIAEGKTAWLTVERFHRPIFAGI